ncbi:CRISPR-associated helicase Cas3, subtype I-F/YPEST [Citrobacter koseri]|nr:CRISPR-associated helicase Cas3, subtype I-F/YPEST [Citrobacter koseri]
MNVLIISRCTKRAREESCRILDQFAERTGVANHHHLRRR